MRKSGNLLLASLSEGDAAALRPLEAARALPHDQIAALHSNKLAISETLPTVSVWFRKTGAVPKSLVSSNFIGRRVAFRV